MVAPLARKRVAKSVVIDHHGRQGGETHVLEGLSGFLAHRDQTPKHRLR